MDAEIGKSLSVSTTFIGTPMQKSIYLKRLPLHLYRSIAASLLLYGPLVQAVEPRVYQLGDGGAIAPHLSIEIGTDSNVLRRNDGSDSSSYVRLEPSFDYIVQQRNNRLTLGYEGDYYLYGEDYCIEPRDVDCPNGSPQFDKASYQDHIFSANGFLEISRQLRATLVLSQSLLNQPAGTGLSVNDGALQSLTEPDSYTNSNVRAELSYGAPQARGELRFGVTHLNKKYGEETRNFEALSEQSIGPSAAILYRVGNRTQLLAGLSTSDVTGGNSERAITRQFIGVEIDASAITSGAFQLKNVRENFAGNQTDLEYVGWDVELSWKPRRYSTVTVGGGRETSRGLFNLDDPALATFTTPDLGLTTDIEVDWVHFWKERFSTELGFQWQQNKVIGEQAAGALGGGASDVITTVRIEGNYNLRRWLDVGAFVVSDTRDGGSDERDYNRTLVGLTANGTF